jgi:nitrogen fixation NifU-like protein
MRDDLRHLYQTIILEHARAPCNFRQIDEPCRRAHGNNPMCGDDVTVFLRLGPTGDIADMSFEAKGCALLLASASLMTERLHAATVEEALYLYDAFLALCTGPGPAAAEPAEGDPKSPEALGDLRAFSGVRAFPVRIRCATLPWLTMLAALRKEADAPSN